MFEEDTLKHIAKFYDAYEIILKEPTTFDNLKRALISNGMPETSARRCISDFRYPFCSAILEQGNGGSVRMNQEGVEQFICGMADWLGVEMISMNVYEEQKAEMLKEAKRNSDINRDLTAENSDLCHKLTMQKRKMKAEQEKQRLFSIDMKELQDLYDAKVEEMNVLCTSPGKLFKQLLKAVADKLLKKEINTDTVINTSGPLDQKR